MNAMQKSMFIDALATRKENLKKSVEDAKKESKDLNIFQTYQKGMIDGAVIAVEEEIKCIETYLTYLQECETEELQKTLH
ncbi:hypothetical protein PP655_gp111 [Bacillus phage PBC4]|uniref:Uncharacterized protein n=1 Tax=Bacillus phage PBC4 TaxID=1675028 RepID=A0A1D6X8F6_9CAUD|nr:hypothetical protein PP655_gp111 [Bacillus phage PBC4]AKQ08303.1 hypothetical protein PBC4_111 [Bacillus phage PBC4]